MKKELYKGLPIWVKYLLVISEGWLVGSAIQSTIEGKPPKDVDVIVEDPELFQRAVQYITGCGFEVKINTFGGLKFTKKLITNIVASNEGHLDEIHEDTIEVDMWVETVGHFILNRRKNVDSPVYNLKRAVFLKPEE